MNNKFDSNISFRTMILTGIAGWLAASKFKLPAEAITPIMALVGLAYDALAFKIKSRKVEDAWSSDTN